MVVPCGNLFLIPLFPSAIVDLFSFCVKIVAKTPFLYLNFFLFIQFIFFITRKQLTDALQTCYNLVTNTTESSFYLRKKESRYDKSENRKGLTFDV